MEFNHSSKIWIPARLLNKCVSPPPLYILCLKIISFAALWTFFWFSASTISMTNYAKKSGNWMFIAGAVCHIRGTRCSSIYTDLWSFYMITVEPTGRFRSFCCLQLSDLYSPLAASLWALVCGCGIWRQLTYSSHASPSFFPLPPGWAKGKQRRKTAGKVSYLIDTHTINMEWRARI